MFNDPFLENCAVYEITWKNVVESGKLNMITWRMGIACLIPKAINTLPEYVILIAFPIQQWLHELTSMLRYMYIARLLLLFRLLDYNLLICRLSPPYTPHLSVTYSLL
jgi:hypothetical protein